MGEQRRTYKKCRGLLQFLPPGPNGYPGGVLSASRMATRGFLVAGLLATGDVVVVAVVAPKVARQFNSAIVLQWRPQTFTAIFEPGF